jgi:hypothetical protein
MRTLFLWTFVLPLYCIAVVLCRVTGNMDLLEDDLYDDVPPFPSK